MSRLTAWTVHASTALVGATGLVYAWMRYFTAPVDEFAVVGHPWQPQLQHLHIWTAPLLVFAVGLIWRDHVWRHVRRRVRDRRRSGLSLLLGCAPMIASGYLIQTAAGEGWRQTWVALHVTASALFLLGYGAHAARPIRTALRRSGPAAARAGGRRPNHEVGADSPPTSPTSSTRSDDSP